MEFRAGQRVAEDGGWPSKSAIILLFAAMGCDSLQIYLLNVTKRPGKLI
jgi:hypothetical protein